MSFRTRLATTCAKLVRTVVRLLGRGGGSSLPGLVALRIDQRYIEHAVAGVGRTVVVAGTNGKTTTARTIASAVRANGQSLVANAEGANLASGIAAALAIATPLLGRLRRDVAVLEVDEDALPKVATSLRIDVLVLTNLFRDQLDRYGEVDSIAKRWSSVVRALPDGARLVVNANDPRLAHLATLRRGSVSFGVDDARVLGAPNHTAADVVRCPSCGGGVGGARFMAHLGVLRCTACSFATPRPNVVLTGYAPRGTAGSHVTLLMPSGPLELETQLVGRFNALNLAAAAAAARALGLARHAFTRGVAAAGRVFGRGEQLTVNGRNVVLHLAKNPTGYNEVLRSITDVEPAPHLLLALNDNWADGQDVSWIWDVDFESVAPRAAYLATTGQRSGDLALRLSVAGAERVASTDANLGAAFEVASGSVEKGSLHVVASYTALLLLRQELARRGLVNRAQI